MKYGWVTVLLLLLTLEKVIQHAFVTLAFYFNWSGIRGKVAASPQSLMLLGAVAAVLFGAGLWGLLTGKRWAVPLVMLLAAFDLLGEFVAQGRVDIVINVSFIVAAVLLVLGSVYRQREA
jgi:hypothetical protein